MCGVPWRVAREPGQMLCHRFLGGLGLRHLEGCMHLDFHILVERPSRSHCGLVESA